MWFPTVRVLPDTTSPVRHSAWTENEGEGSFVTNTTTLGGAPVTGADETPKRVGGLSTMKLAELQGLAGGLGLTDTAKMRKSDLVTAIKARQSGGSPSTPAVAASSSSEPAAQTSPPAAERPVRTSRRAQRPVMHSPSDDGAATSEADQTPLDTAVAADAPRDDSSRHDGRPQRQNDRQQGGRQNGRQQENRQNESRGRYDQDDDVPGGRRRNRQRQS